MDIKQIKVAKEAFTQATLNEPVKLASIAEAYVSLLESHYWESTASEQYHICKTINNSVLPKLKRALERDCGSTAINKLVNIYEQSYLITCRRIMENFAFYVESFKSKKVWDRTADTMRPAFEWCDEFISGDLELIRMSLMPGIGKSYTSNLTCAMMIGNDPNISILRITYSDDLVKITTRQTIAIINSEAFRNVFPRYKDIKYKDTAIFKNKSVHTFCVADSEDEFTLFAVTRDG